MTEPTTGPMPGSVPGPPPYTEDVVMALPLHSARRELLEEIMSTPTPTRRTAHAPITSTDKARRTSWLVVVASAAAAAVVIAGPVWWAGRSGSDPATTSSSTASGSLTYASSHPSSAAASPLVLLNAPGWKVTHVFGFGTAEGEITFRNGNQQLQVNWRPAAYYDEYFQDRANGNTQMPVELLGKPSTMFTYGEGDYTTIRPVEGDSFLEVRGGVGDQSAYLAVLQQLVSTDMDTWLAAMPPEVVLPSEAANTIQAMLNGVPTPPGFDDGTIPTQLTDRYDFGVGVTGTVACAWIERWQQSTQAGHDAAASAAVTALQSSKHWPILLEMDKQGDYPQVLWQTADAVQAGNTPEGYKSGLGCNN